MSAISLPKPPPPATVSFAPRPLRWTATEFNRMGDTGLFEGRRPFLIDGVIWEQQPMEPQYAAALGLVTEAVRVAFGAGWRYRNQSPLHLDEYNDPVPDLSILAGSPRDSDKHPSTASLVIEVADTSLTIDTTVKAERYATAGVPDYWVLDLNGRRLLVFRDPAPLPAGLGATAYRAHLTYAPGDAVAPLAVPTASIPVADLIP